MRRTGKRFNRKRIAAGRYHQRTAQGSFGIKRRNALKPWKKRVMRSGLTGKGTFKKRYDKKRFKKFMSKY